MNLFKSYSPLSIGVICIIVGTFCFAAKGIVIKLAYQAGSSAAPLLMLRMLIALPFYAVIALLIQRQGLAPLSWAQRWKIIGLGLLSYYVSSLLDFMGLQYISAGLERVILYVYPTLVLIMLALWKQQAITKNTKVALAIAYSGMMLVFFQDLHLTPTWNATLLGAGLVMLSTVSFAVFVVLAGDVIPAVGSSRFTAYAMLAACAGVIAHSLISLGAESFQQSLHVYQLAFILALFCTVIPSFLMNKGISIIGSGKAAVLGSIGPVITLFLGAIFLNEPITFIQLGGAALVIGGVTLATRNSN